MSVTMTPFSQEGTELFFVVKRVECYPSVHCWFIVGFDVGHVTGPVAGVRVSAYCVWSLYDSLPAIRHPPSLPIP